MTETTRIRVTPKPIESKWEISWDGYYPYCDNCSYEPSYSEVLAGLPDICPKCRAHMLNYKDMWLKNRKDVPEDILTTV